MIDWKIVSMWPHRQCQGRPFYFARRCFSLERLRQQGSGSEVFWSNSNNPAHLRNKTIAFSAEMAFLLQSCQEMSLQSSAVLHEGQVCRCKAVKTTSRPFKLLPVGFVIPLALFFFWGGEALESSRFESFLKLRDVLAAAWGGGGVQAAVEAALRSAA